MPLLRAEGIVLRVLPLGEADKIVTFLTRDEGKVRGVAKSARKSRKRFGSSLEPWSRVALALYEKEGGELARIDACDLLESAYRLHENLEAAYVLAYLAEVAEMFTRERQAEPHYYRLLVSLLSGLKSGLPIPIALRYFEIWTLRLHGLLADPTVCSAGGEKLGEGGGVFQASSGQLLCRKCLARPAPGDLALPGEALAFVDEALRRHPADLVASRFSAPLLRRVGRMTTMALSEFAGLGFRTSRFLAVAEGAGS